MFKLAHVLDLMLIVIYLYILLYIYVYIFKYVVKFLMQVICYELLGFCFHFHEQLFNLRRLEIEKLILNTTVLWIHSLHNISFKNNKHQQVKSVKSEIHLLIHEIFKLLKTSYQGLYFSLFFYFYLKEKKKDGLRQR